MVAVCTALIAAILLEASVGESVDTPLFVIGLVLFGSALVAARAPSLFWVSPERARPSVAPESEVASELMEAGSGR